MSNDEPSTVFDCGTASDTDALAAGRAPWNGARALATALAETPDLRTFPRATLDLVATYLDYTWLLFTGAPSDNYHFAVAPALAFGDCSRSVADAGALGMSAAFTAGIVPLPPPRLPTWTIPSRRRRRATPRDDLSPDLALCEPDDVHLLSTVIHRRCDPSRKAVRPSIHSLSERRMSLLPPAAASTADARHPRRGANSLVVWCCASNDGLSRAVFHLDFDTGEWGAVPFDVAETPDTTRAQWCDGTLVLKDAGQRLCVRHAHGSDVELESARYASAFVCLRTCSSSCERAVVSAVLPEKNSAPDSVCSLDGSCCASGDAAEHLLAVVHVHVHESRLHLYRESLSKVTAIDGVPVPPATDPREVAGGDGRKICIWRTRTIPAIAGAALGAVAVSIRAADVTGGDSLARNTGGPSTLPNTDTGAADRSTRRTEVVFVYGADGTLASPSQLYDPVADRWSAMPNWALPAGVRHGGHHVLTQADDWLVLAHHWPLDIGGLGEPRIYVLDTAAGAAARWSRVHVGRTSYGSPAVVAVPTCGQRGLFRATASPSTLPTPQPTLV